MVQISEDVAKKVLYIGMGSVVLSAVNGFVIKGGHLFALFSKASLPQALLIGAVQGLATRFLTYVVDEYVKRNPKNLSNNQMGGILIVTQVVGCALSAVTLFAISFIAFKAGIVASALSLSALATLTLANAALSIGALFFHRLESRFEKNIITRLDNAGWILDDSDSDNEVVWDSDNEAVRDSDSETAERF